MTRRRAQNRQALVSAARRVFVRDGFERATIAAIAEEADLGFGTFYRYFPDKAAALAAVADEVRQDIDDVLDEAAYADGPAADAIQRFTMRFVECVNRNKDVFLLLWQVTLHHPDEARAREDFPPRVGATLARIIARGMKSGEFATSSAERSARLITGMHLSLIPGPAIDARLAADLCSFELGGLGVAPQKTPAGAARAYVNRR
jgi:AcrR family transcriptional regulator